MSDEAYDVALGVLRGFTMGEEVGSQALAVIESQNQALQERLTRAEMSLSLMKQQDYAAQASDLSEMLNDADADKRALQERAEKLETALREILRTGSIRGSTRDALKVIHETARNVLSPTQETDPE